MPWRRKGNESRKHEEKRKGDVQLLKGQIEGINWKKKKRVESDLTSGLNSLTESICSIHVLSFLVSCVV